MNILHVISSFPPAYSYGGPAQQAYLICQELVKRGHNVTVYTTDVLDRNNRFIIDSNPIFVDGIEVYHFRNISNTLAHMNFSCAPGMASALKCNIKKYDIIHLHEFRTFQAIITHYYAKKYTIPYIFQARGDIDQIIRLQRIKHFFDRIWGLAICQDCIMCIPTSQLEAEQYKKMGITEKKIEVIPNIIDLNFYKKLPKYGGFRKCYGIKDEEKIILSLGRLHIKKGLDLLITAFAELEKEIDNIRLVIVGPDEGFLSNLIKLSRELKIENKVVFTGPLYQEKKLEAYVDSDVFVLASKSENFGNVVVEALACGKPVIVTNKCGVSEFVLKDLGYVINYDKGQLINCMLDILKDDLKRQWIQKNSLNAIIQFSSEKIVNNIEKLYKISSLCQ